MQLEQRPFERGGEGGRREGEEGGGGREGMGGGRREVNCLDTPERQVRGDGEEGR